MQREPVSTYNAMCIDCEYFKFSECSRRRGCYLIPAIVRLDKLLRA